MHVHMTWQRYRSVAAVLAVMLLAILSGCPRGQEEKGARNKSASAVETVKAYCDLDAQAARLTSETWGRVRPYIAWEEEAGWDRTVVISGYAVKEVKKRSDTAETVIVEYHVLGILSGDYLSSRRTETVKFTLRKTDLGWKITAPDFMPPHVLLQPLLKHLEETKNLELADKLKGAEG